MWLEEREVVVVESQGEVYAIITIKVSSSKANAHQKADKKQKTYFPSEIFKIRIHTIVMKNEKFKLKNAKVPS